MNEYFKNIEELFVVGSDISNSIEHKFLQLNIDEESLEMQVFYFFHSKVRKTYQAIKLLWDKGFSEDAFILSRTLYEISLQARYIQSDPQLLVERYLRFDPVRRWKHYLNFKKNADRALVQELEEKSSKSLEELKKLHDESMGKFNYKGQNWWGDTIEWLALKLGNGKDSIYSGLYPIQSGFVHSDVRSSRSYIKFAGYDEEFKGATSLQDDIVIPVESTRCLILVAWSTSKICGFKMDQEISSAIEQVRRLSGMGNK